jgi:hypothetical protein
MSTVLGVEMGASGASPVRIVEIPSKQVVPHLWDAFAQQCGASYFCAYDALALQLKDALRFQRRFFEIRAAATKVGQCAVAAGSKQSFFLDGIQLLPHYEPLWRPSMTALLDELGPGQYRYGSEWSIEPKRQAMLQSIPGVALETVKPVVVQAVDFARWESWEAYLHDISENARRNAKRALLRHPDLRIRTRRNLSALADTLAIARLRFGVASRKKLDIPLATILAGFVFRTAALRRYAVTAVAKGSGGARAAMSGIEFGGSTFYLTGGSTPQNDGAAWHLTLAMLRDTFDRTSGHGKFVMGQILKKDSPGWQSLARSREQVRPSEFPTSVITFSYDEPSNLAHVRRAA